MKDICLGTHFTVIDEIDLISINGGFRWSELTAAVLGGAGTGAGIGAGIGGAPNPAWPATALGGAVGGAVIGGVAGAGFYLFG